MNEQDLSFHTFACHRNINLPLNKRNIMKRAFIYKDEKSHKFWWIDYSGCEFAVNYGKFDSIGKFGIYIDSEEYGLHPKTSHPQFTEHFTEEFYYDCTDEEAPFGSDEGSDTLNSLEEAIRKNPNLNFTDYPQYLIQHDWGMEYIPVETLDPESIKKLASKKEMDMTQSDMVTYATAFGQIKITGRLSLELQERGVKAIKRLALLWGDGLTEIQSRIDRKSVV